MISFQTDGVSMPLFDEARVCRWIEAVADAHGHSVGNVAYCFCDDAKILDANRQFLGHDYYTDVITFDYTRRGRVAGDILISLDTVASNSERFGRPYEEELLRVVIHGVLHLCGIDDRTDEQQAAMTAAENGALAMYAL